MVSLMLTFEAFCDVAAGDCLVRDGAEAFRGVAILPLGR